MIEGKNCNRTLHSMRCRFKDSVTVQFSAFTPFSFMPSSRSSIVLFSDISNISITKRVEPFAVKTYFMIFIDCSTNLSLNTRKRRYARERNAVNLFVYFSKFTTYFKMKFFERKLKENDYKIKKLFFYVNICSLIALFSDWKVRIALETLPTREESRRNSVSHRS